MPRSANACSGEFGPEVDEWDVAGVEGLPSEVVAPMRVADAPAALECRVRQVLELGDVRSRQQQPGGRVDRADPRARRRDGRLHVPLPEALDLVARMGGDEWCTTRDRFTLPRPATADPAQVAAELERRNAAIRV